MIVLQTILDQTINTTSELTETFHVTRDGFQSIDLVVCLAVTITQGVIVSVCHTKCHCDANVYITPVMCISNIFDMCSG